MVKLVGAQCSLLEIECRKIIHHRVAVGSEGKYARESELRAQWHEARDVDDLTLNR